MRTFIFTVSKFSKVTHTMRLPLVLCTLSSNAQTLNVVSTSSVANARGAANDANMALVFNDNVDAESVKASSSKCFGNQGLPVNFASPTFTSFTDHTTTAALQINTACRNSNQQPPASRSILKRSYYEL